jgi:predicted TIM-barrel fold metal-dependent hydrolase
MRYTRTATALLIVLGLGIAIGAQGRRGGAAIKPGEECPPGTTETRPGSCQAPEFPPPSILDYRPRSTLVTAEHKVPRAKFPVIDIHGHPPGINTPEGLASMVADMDRLNLRVMTSASNTSGTRLTQQLAVINASPYKDRFRVFTGVDFRDVGPGWAEKAVAQLEADIKAGAIGVGEISKSFGLQIRKRDGSRLRVDDPDLDPVWQAAARLDIPIFIHTAEPQEFFSPLDYKNERWL